MTSRLDRLFILLESGSSPITRKAAAKQIGEVQKLHPHELHNLLNRLITFLHSSNWDTRIAASQAVQAILENVPQWTPLPVEGGSSQSSVEANPCNSDTTRLSFDKFDLDNVLRKGAHLMGSEGKEFDLIDEGEPCDERERLAKQRELLNEKLGLKQAKCLGIQGIDELVTLDDMKLQPAPAPKTRSNNLRPCPPLKLLPVQEILTDMSSKTSPGVAPSNGSPAIAAASSAALSCREMNRARRKARQQNSANNTPTPSASRSSSTNGGSSFNFDDAQQPDRKRPKVGGELNGKAEAAIPVGEPTPDVTGAWPDSVVDWPLESFCSKLYLDLFNTRWEVRHGSATALRELLKTHSNGAGQSVTMTKTEMEENHQKWLEDAALRLLCVLALDRFGDFVSDQVVAPVRETCAQVLGFVLKNMPVEKMFPTIDILLKFVKQREWEVRHGGLLGIKYLLVVRADMLQKILPLIINDVLAGLFDPVDDVGAVSATTLIPIASFLPKLLDATQVSQIVKMLWDLLLDQDELTSACNSFMGLLAAILSLPDASQWIQMEPMSVLIPRLWPFLSHSTSSVRRSTLQTLLTLTKNLNTFKTEPVDDKSKISLNADAQKCDIKLPAFAASTPTATANTLVLNFGVKDWPPALLQKALRHIFQRVLVEHVPDIQQLVEQVWDNLVVSANLSSLLHATCPFVSCWLCLAMQPARLGFDPAHLISYKPIQSKERKHRCFDLHDNHVAVQQKMYLGGTETVASEQREKNVTRARHMACRMIGLLSRYLVLPAPGVEYTADVESPIDCYTKVLIGYLSSRSSLQRLISGMVIAFWAENDSTIQPGPPQLQDKLRQCLLEHIYYDEVAGHFTRLLQEARDYLATLKQHKVNVADFETNVVLTLDQVNQLCQTMRGDQLRAKYNLKPKIFELLEERRRGLANSYANTTFEQSTLNIATQAALAGAVVNLRCLPEKLNPVVKPLMESIKREESEIFQKMAARFLAHLLDQIVDRDPCPNNKIVGNLCALLKSDTDFTPRIVRDDELKACSSNSLAGGDEEASSQYLGILTLVNQQKAKDLNGGAAAAPNARGPGRPPLADLAAAEDSNEALASEDPSRKVNRVQRIGASHTISTICRYFDKELPQKIPILWKIMFEQIGSVDDDYVKSLGLLVKSGSFSFADDAKTNELVTALQTVEVAAPHLSPKLHDALFTSLLPKLCVLLKHPLKAIRHLSARCMATMAVINSSRVMHVVMSEVLLLLATIENVYYRQGAAEAIACIVDQLQIQIIPYVVLLVVPLLGRMSDPDKSVRLISTHCFANLIQLMPLDGTIPNAGDLSTALQVQKVKDRQFLEYLFSPKTIPNFEVPVKINAELRSYQQAGINWLWFLNKYKLHGILCDDMGLGKTIQTICILAGDHYLRQQERLATLPSIVICPPTLTGHWIFEVNKFLVNNFLAPLHYVGLPSDREKLRTKIRNHQLVVASYDIVRKDIDFFKAVHWNYCVLDEGHVIKNGKTKSSKAIKQLIANHRLILSGTPIQNNVLELWSLFDFLMPGFLGTEKQFMTKFSRPILASRDAKSSAKDQEAGALAMESLHRQVLPFLLRRVKEDVLTDLPPKILADLYCDLSPLQERLYEDFSKSHLNSEIRDCLENIDDKSVSKKTTHVFQALRYLQNVCNHPKLVLNAHHPEFKQIIGELMRRNSSLEDIEHAAKLPALKQLLLDCGIGTNCDEMVSVNQHRALIFCQLKAMLDIIENDLLKKHLPNVSYMRLDGSVPASSRHSIVTKFNSDPSIDVLLLTTQVGGLGLNLTGADTVIFVEHDWNPMKDLQAMDRAHRIGQKKVVNVYRLITKKSMEEKIMGLQKFKLLTANTIVTDENASMETMGTDNLLDLFNLGDEGKGKPGRQQDAGASTSGGSVKNILENLPELWTNDQYDEEYDLNMFLEGLNK